MPESSVIPVSDDAIERHLRGSSNSQRRGTDYVMGVYPLLHDDRCWFLAAGFDGENWAEDACAYLETCRARNVPAALERSRSGQGGHVWIFFAELIAAREARQLGAALMTETMERRPEIGFKSYDRFFPNQDAMPTGGFGNLIALPRGFPISLGCAAGACLKACFFAGFASGARPGSDAVATAWSTSPLRSRHVPPHLFSPTLKLPPKWRKMEV